MKRWSRPEEFPPTNASLEKISGGWNIFFYNNAAQKQCAENSLTWLDGCSYPSSNYICEIICIMLMFWPGWMNSKHTGHTGQLLPSDPPLQHQLVPSSPPNIHLAWTFHRPCHQQVLSVRRKKGENGAKILMWSKWYLVGCHDARKGVSQRPVWLSCLT